jgi:hypothetical protein
MARCEKKQTGNLATALLISLVPIDLLVAGLLEINNLNTL